MPINSGPGIGGRPGGGISSFVPPTTKPAAAAGAKWVITEAGVGHTGSAARGPVTGSCIDILSDAWAWLCAIGGSLAVAFLTYEATADTTSTSKWVYIGASFAGYLCAIFIAGFAVAAFLWMGTRSKWAMRFGFTLVTAVVATAPIAINKFKLPRSSEAAETTTAVQVEPIEEAAAAAPVAEAAPVLEEPAPPVTEPEPEPAFLTRKSSVRIGPGRRAVAAEPAARNLSPSSNTTGARTGESQARTAGRSTDPRGAPERTSPGATNVDLKIVSAEVRTLLADIRTDASELQSKLQAEGLDSILAPTSFAGSARILNARRRLANIKRITDEYERTVIARFSEFPERIYGLNVSDELKEAAVHAFEARQSEVLRKLREIAQLHRSILGEADRLFVFMDGRIGRYKVSDRILFQNAADAERYTAHIERLQALGAKEERAVVENQKAALSRIASMERELIGVGQ